MTEITKEEAMAAIAFLASEIGPYPLPDRCEDLLISSEQAHTLLTLARAGAEVMFASEETVERVDRAIEEAMDEHLLTMSGNDHHLKPIDIARLIRRAALAALTPPRS